MITLEISTWTEFKSTCITKKNLDCQYEDKAGQYEIYGPDSNNIIWHSNIVKTDPAGMDQQDFETNYKSKFNGDIGNAAYPFALSTYEFMPNMAGPEMCPAGGTKSAFFKIVENCLLNGGKLVMDGNAVFGDFVDVALVDHDNLLGYGVDFPLKQWVPKWGVDWKSCTDSIITTYSGSPPIGMYLRLTYHSTGIVPVAFLVNYMLHRPL